MLPLENRLKKKKDFENVFKKGKGFKLGFLYLKKVSNNLGKTRFGFITSSKFSKKAVERNKARRELKKAVKDEILNIKKGFDVAIVVLPESKNKIDNLEKNIINLLKKAGLSK